MVLLPNTVQEYIIRMPHLNYVSGGVVHLNYDAGEFGEREGR